MANKNIVSHIGFVVMASAALWLGGCVEGAGEGGGAGENDAAEGPVGEVEQAIGAECAAAAPTASFVSVLDYTSPQTYNTVNCFKGVVVDVKSYASTAPLGDSIFTGVGWADAVPLASQANHVADCQNLFLQADLFEIVNGVPVFKTSRQARGQWLTDFPAPNTCQAPGVSFSDLMIKGRTYRVSATARTTASSSAPTRRLTIVTDFLPTPR
ncbi:MAG TPA: hypothetical protein VFS00_33105 [Polyangiaceae bacterium]|nr:hypothetical protein [Polyangiaceae bacterium]